MKFDERNKKELNLLFFISMVIAAQFVLLIQIFLAYLVPLDVGVVGNITANICEVWSEFKIFCILVTMGTAAILNFINPKSCHTLRWIFLQSMMKFDERNPYFFKSPFFCFHGNFDKICPTDSDFFGCLRSHICECCSYQLSSISVRRVTCYDNFCVFNFLAF